MPRILSALTLALASLTLLPTSSLAAANEQNASCIGVGASSVAPGTKDDISLYINELAAALGTTHGQLVTIFSQQKGVCVVLPPVPPHP